MKYRWQIVESVQLVGLNDWEREGAKLASGPFVFLRHGPHVQCIVPFHCLQASVCSAILTYQWSRCTEIDREFMAAAEYLQRH